MKRQPTKGDLFYIENMADDYHNEEPSYFLALFTGLTFAHNDVFAEEMAEFPKSYSDKWRDTILFQLVDKNGALSLHYEGNFLPVPEPLRSFLDPDEVPAASRIHGTKPNIF
tara:strand:- start:13 stop:348 length:336 start_codon:yes stop_codon:yes gene_type:complete